MAKQEYSNAQPESGDSIGWQAQKSASTRNSILQAALDCFIELGYANTTTAKIAQRAGLSRGAMLHHFPSKGVLVEAAVRYLHQRRIEDFRESIKALGDEDDRISAGIDTYWQHLTSPLFVAFHELCVASRTDPELAEILKPAIEEFNQEWYTTARRVFPEWEATGDLFDFAMDLTQHFMEGLALNQMTENVEERTNRLLGYLKDRLAEIFRQGLEGGDNAVSNSMKN